MTISVNVHVSCRSHQLKPVQHHESHNNLPKRGETWQQSAEVAEFLQKGHVHFADSVSVRASA